MKPNENKSSKAFTLIEILIVIAVIGIMSALVIAAFTGAAQDTRKVIARQQQASIQSAVNAWVNSESSKFGSGITESQQVYNATADSAAKLTLVARYLDNSTLEHFGFALQTDGTWALVTGDRDKIISRALRKTDQYLELTNWENGSFPKVELRDN